MYAFNTTKPSTVAEAVAAIAEKDDGSFLAGGQTYIPTLKQRLAMPSDLIDLSGVAELKGIKTEGDNLVIGAMTTHGEVAYSDVVESTIPGLTMMARVIGDPQVRNMGTIGGSIANNDPAADYPAAVVGLNATVKTNKREIAGGDFFTGLFETALEDGELITAVSFPKPTKAGYAKFRNPASRYAMVGVLAAQTAEGVRVAVIGAGPCVFRVKEMEDALSSNFSPDAIADIKVSAGNLNSDLHGSAEYRANLVTVMAKRAVAAAK